MQDVVMFVKRKDVELKRIDDNTYSFHPERGMVWLQKMCFFFLKRLGVNHETVEVKTIRKVIDGVPALEMILRQKYTVDDFMHSRCERILIGSEDYAELMTCDMANQVITFDSHTRIGRGGGICVYEMPITIIPWMKGVLLVPSFNDSLFV